MPIQYNVSNLYIFSRLSLTSTLSEQRIIISIKINSDTKLFIIINAIFSFFNLILLYYTKTSKNHAYILKDYTKKSARNDNLLNT